jgi:hypothetical protein
VPESATPQSKPAPLETWLIVGMALAAAGLQVWLRFFAYGTFIDDAYIFMRYAENFREGQGLVYNVGEPVMGFTSPLFTLLLGSLAWLFRSVNIESLVFGLNLGFWALSTWLIAGLFGQGRSLRLLAVFLWCFYFPYTDAAVNGMETMMFVATILGTVRLLQVEKWGFALFLALVSILVRPEGALLALATFGFLVVRRRFAASAFGLGCGIAVLALWAAYASAVYGSPIPQSMLAKSAISTSGLSQADVSPLTILRCLVFGVSSEATKFTPWVLSALAASAGALAALRRTRERPEVWVLFAVFALFVAFYVAGKPTHMWSWYGIPASVCLILAICMGTDDWTKGWGRPARFASSALVVLGVAGLGYVGLRMRVERLQAFAHANRNLVQMIREWYPGSETIMLGDIGIVGYHTKARIVDLAGLVSKKTLSLGPDGKLLSYGAVIRQEKPDVIAFRGDPLTADSLEEAQVRRVTFDDRDQRKYFEDNYVRIPSKDPYYVAVFVWYGMIASGASSP